MTIYCDLAGCYARSRNVFPRWVKTCICPLVLGAAGLLSSQSIVAAESLLLRSHVVIDAYVVASSCRVVVQADGMNNSTLSLGTYNKATGGVAEAKPFSIWLFEDGSMSAGCSALQVGGVATVQFGNPGQLDEGGVVMRGAGDGVRVEVRALDSEADYREVISVNNAVVRYPVDFAAKGLLRFQAQPVRLDKAQVGRYGGSLAFVVSYQ